jgi:hypothetical protein
MTLSRPTDRFSEDLIITGEKLRCLVQSIQCSSDKEGTPPGRSLYVDVDHAKTVLEEAIESSSSASPRPLYIVLTHNGDHPITDAEHGRLFDRVDHWFAQNTDTVHSHLIPVPIGLANSQWPHGNLNRFVDIFRHFTPPPGRKPLCCYFGFSIHTYPAHREHLRQIISAANPEWTFLGTFPFPFAHYCAHLARHKYCICPRGNGIDTHRLWECLYLGVIPLVERNPVNEFFVLHGLPMVIVDDWSLITEEYLETHYETHLQTLCGPSDEWRVFTMKDFENLLGQLLRARENPEDHVVLRFSPDMDPWERLRIPTTVIWKLR